MLKEFMLIRDYNSLTRKTNSKTRTILLDQKGYTVMTTQVQLNI